MPEIDHDEARALLNAAVDGELDAMTSQRFEAHLTDCPDCAAEFARMSAMSAAIRERATRHAAPDDLRNSLTIQLQMKALSFDGGGLAPDLIRGLGEGDLPAKKNGPIVRLRWLRPAAGGFALGAALAASLAILIDDRTVQNSATDSIVAAHIRALQPGHLTDVQISDQHQVKPWFDGKIDFAPPVKDLAAQGFDLVGGRLDYVDGHEAAVIVYRRKLHLIDVFVERAGSLGTRSGAQSFHAAPHGYNIERWTEEGQDYWAVSDLNRTELSEFADAWRGR